MNLSKGGIDRFIFYRYRYGIGMFVLFAASIFLLTFQLSNLVVGISNTEAAQGLSNESLRQVVSNPVYAPYKLLQWLSITLLGHTVLALRIPSIIFGAASVALLYDVFRHWHKQRIAIVGSLFFVTSSWFLHFSRLGTSAVVLPFFVLILLWAGTKLHHAPVRRWPFLVMAVAVALSLYVPYMLYFLIAGVALHRYAVKKYLWHLSKKERAAGLAILAILILPMAYAMFRDPSIIRAYFAIPVNLPRFVDYLSNIQNTIGYVFWRSESSPVNHLGNMPMLDIFTATMAALGVYQYEKQLNQHRTKWLFIGTLVLVLTLSVAAHVETFAALAPLVYIFAATGVVTLLVQWYEIFPKNPVARTIGLVPIILLLVIVSNYHANRYFVAWARSPETKAQFNADTTALRKDILNGQAQQIVVVAPEDQHITLRFSLGDVATSVVIMTEKEFADSNITAEVTYVYKDIKLSKAAKEQMKKEGVVEVDREIMPTSYNKYTGPNAQING